MILIYWIIIDHVLLSMIMIDNCGMVHYDYCDFKAHTFLMVFVKIQQLCQIIQCALTFLEFAKNKTDVIS